MQEAAEFFLIREFKCEMAPAWYAVINVIIWSDDVSGRIRQKARRSSRNWGGRYAVCKHGKRVVSLDSSASWSHRPVMLNCWDPFSQWTPPHKVLKKIEYFGEVDWMVWPSAIRWINNSESESCGLSAAVSLRCRLSLTQILCRTNESYFFLMVST
jgi:hypothetical protein